MAKEISYEIIEHLGTVRTKENGYSIQANMISWSGGEPKVDIRNWSAEKKPLKGITLTTEEAQGLADILMSTLNY